MPATQMSGMRGQSVAGQRVAGGRATRRTIARARATGMTIKCEKVMAEEKRQQRRPVPKACLREAPGGYAAPMTAQAACSAGRYHQCTPR